MYSLAFWVVGDFLYRPRSPQYTWGKLWLPIFCMNIYGAFMFTYSKKKVVENGVDNQSPEALPKEQYMGDLAVCF